MNKIIDAIIALRYAEDEISSLVKERQELEERNVNLTEEIFELQFSYDNKQNYGNK